MGPDTLAGCCAGRMRSHPESPLEVPGEQLSRTALSRSRSGDADVPSLTGLPHPTLPEPPEPPARPGFPLIASLAPIVASVAIYAVTRSPFALIFAFLGPIVALGSFTDAALRQRRLRRAGRITFGADVDIARARIDSWHDRERAQRESVDVPIHRLLTTRDRDGSRWSHDGSTAVLVSVGRGRVASSLDLGSRRPARLSKENEVDRALDGLAEAARWIDKAPVSVDAAQGIVVCGSPAQYGIARAIVVRIARLVSPAHAALRVSATSGWDWLDLLPHPRAGGEPPVAPAGVTLIEFVTTGGDPPNGASRLLARVLIAPDLTSAPRAGAVIVADHGRAMVEVGAERVVIAPDYCTATEAAQFAGVLATQARREGLLTNDESLADRVEFASLDNGPRPGTSARMLACALGRSAEGPWVIDLVTDGPHAVIGGTTGSGKSELLVSWVLALASRYPPDEVSVLLVDFKGGAAFTQVAALAHTVGVLSDLEATSARRAIESLGAEVRYRERVLLDAGARSIDELPEGQTMARLIVFVDEFAALVNNFPDLRDLFVDLAARGRSLGVHLVLCTQRPADVLRDAILANVTLRISLRVNERVDSVALLGVGIAANLPRGAVGRAAFSTAGDRPRLVQVALTNETDIERIRSRWSQLPPARRPWCPPLPAVITPESPLLHDSARAPAPGPGEAFAVADVPAEQRQTAVAWEPRRDGHMLVHGTRRSGRSTAITALCRSLPGAIVHVVPEEVEAAWDRLSELAKRTERLSHSGIPALRPVGGDVELITIDDLDHLVARFGTDHDAAFVDLVARVLRDGPAVGFSVVASVTRVTPALSALAVLFDARLLLRMASRQDHLLAHGRGGDHDERMPPGGGWWKGERVQVIRHALLDQARSGESSEGADAGAVDLAGLGTRLLAVVAASSSAMVLALRSTHRIVDIRESGVARRAMDEVARLETLDGETWPVAVVGDVEAWHAAGPALAAIRAVGLVVVHGCTVGEFRALTRIRQHPPPLSSAAERAWVAHPDGTVTRCSV